MYGHPARGVGAAVGPRVCDRREGLCGGARACARPRAVAASTPLVGWSMLTGQAGQLVMEQCGGPRGLLSREAERLGGAGELWPGSSWNILGSRTKGKFSEKRLAECEGGFGQGMTVHGPVGLPVLCLPAAQQP